MRAMALMVGRLHDASYGLDGRKHTDPVIFLSGLPLNLQSPVDEAHLMNLSPSHWLLPTIMMMITPLRSRRSVLP